MFNLSESQQVSAGAFIPRSGENAILLLGGEPGLVFSEARYLFLLLSACCFQMWRQEKRNKQLLKGGTEVLVPQLPTLPRQHHKTGGVTFTLLRRVSLMSLWEPEAPRLPGGPMSPGGGCRGWTPLLAGPERCTGFPPRGEMPAGSIFRRSSLKDSSFFGGLSAENNPTEVQSAPPSTTLTPSFVCLQSGVHAQRRDL